MSRKREVEREVSRTIERDWRRQNVVEGDGYGGNEGWKDDVTSGARCDPKRVGTRSLAGEDSRGRLENGKSGSQSPAISPARPYKSNAH